MYKIIFTDEFDEEIQQIYDYISKNLKEKEIADRFISKVYGRIEDLKIFPKMYMKIEKMDRLHNEYHRLVVNNYIVLYTVDELKQIVAISHIYYKRKNYLI